MRLRIHASQRAMSCPPGVGDANSSSDGVRLERLFEALKAALRFDDMYLAVEYSDARRIVAPMFESAETLDEDTRRITRPDITDNSRHSWTPPMQVRRAPIHRIRNANPSLTT